MKQLTLAFLLVSLTLTAQNPVGIFENATDVGAPKMAGSSQYNPATQTYTLKGGGYNIWFNKDEFHFLYKKISGDFILTANFELVGNEDGNGHRKTGWMIRETTDADAVSINACVHGDGLAVLQWRPIKGAFMRDPKDEIFFPKKFYQIVQLERIGKRITMRLAHPGEPLQEAGSTELPDLKDEVLVGLYALAHDPGDIQEARIWNVRIDRPIPNEFNPNPLVKIPPQQLILGSRLEVMDAATGKRKVILQSNDRFGSPLWMPDGKKIMFSHQGSLFTLPSEGGTPELFNSGSEAGIGYGQSFSPDRKKIAVTSVRDGKAALGVLPAGGGEVQLLPSTGSFNGTAWSPGSSDLYYFSQQGSVSVLFKNGIASRKELTLTSDTKRIAGGPETSPDGKFIYYHENSSGTMQLWRMKPDGTAKERITFDENHNWFPHVSPDGKWIAYLSFPPDVDPNGLPSHKNVAVKLIPTSIGAPRVVAYLYGGQGSLNSPCWSPDSKNLVFVSNF